MNDEIEEADRNFYQDLKTRILTAAIQPEQVIKMIEAIEGKEFEDTYGAEEFAKPMSDEEMENYVPIAMAESAEAIAALRRFGLAVSDT